jgi:hypothetical protein
MRCWGVFITETSIMRRLITLAIAAIAAVALSGCIVVPVHRGYYGYDRGYDHGYGYHGERGDRDR